MTSIGNSNFPAAMAQSAFTTQTDLKVTFPEVGSCDPTVSKLMRFSHEAQTLLFSSYHTP